MRFYRSYEENEDLGSSLLPLFPSVNFPALSFSAGQPNCELEVSNTSVQAKAAPLFIGFGLEVFMVWVPFLVVDRAAVPDL